MKELDRNKISKYSPRWLKNCVKRIWPNWFYRQVSSVYSSRNPFSGEDEYVAPDDKYPFTLGIIKQFRHYHKHYIAACHDIGVSCKVLDISGSDWIDVIKNYNCDAYLIWPSSLTGPLRSMFDERLKVMVDDLGKIIYPLYNELWLWENKRRVRDWLIAHDVPHPKTWIFYDFDTAREFIKNANLPLVFKTNRGYAATGVTILRTKREALRVTKRAITRGIHLQGSHPSDYQWGSAILQEYIPDVREIRVVKISESFFGYEKLKVGDFHSGSGLHKYPKLNSKLLDFVENLCKKENFTSMDVDVFITPDGNFLVNELQTVFGSLTSMVRFSNTNSAEHCVLDGKPGRMLKDRQTGQWIFKEGAFCQNALCNLRVQYVLDMLSARGKLSNQD